MKTQDKLISFNEFETRLCNAGLSSEFMTPFEFLYNIEYSLTRKTGYRCRGYLEQLQYRNLARIKEIPSLNKDIFPVYECDYIAINEDIEVVIRFYTRLSLWTYSQFFLNLSKIRNSRHGRSTSNLIDAAAKSGIAYHIVNDPINPTNVDRTEYLIAEEEF